jgi:outer membrane protein assembly factor BamA
VGFHVLRRAASWLFGLTLLAALAGCSTKELPRGALVIDRVDVVGAELVEEEGVTESIATSETTRVLGGLLEGIPLLTFLDALTVEYHTFDRHVLQRDLERIRRYYRARGFYAAEVTAGRVVPTDHGHVRVEIVVAEGDAVLVEDAQLAFPEWQQAFKANLTMRDVTNDYRSKPRLSGETLPRFDEDRYDQAKQELLRALTDHGFAYGTVNGKASVDLPRRRARVHFDVVAGPRCRFGAVTLEGLGEIPEGPVRSAIGFESGDDYSTAKIDAAHYALADLQVFGSVEIEAELPPATKNRTTDIPVIIRFQPIKLRAVKVGLGAEVGSQIDVHGILGWEDRNFLGGLRRITIETRPGLVFFPTRLETIVTQPPTDVVPEAELRVDFKQPAFPEGRTNTLLSSAARIYLPQSTLVPDPVPEDYNIVGYREVDGALGLDRKFRSSYIGKSTAYAAQFIKLRFDDPFSYNFDDPPEGFQRVLIPYLETLASWDWRLDKDGEPTTLQPHSGLWFGFGLQFAGGFLQGDADDIRLRPELRAYAPVTDEVTVAVRWATGFLFPRNYGDSLLPDSEAEETVRARDLQLMSFRGFFSGGPTSNRGYGYRGVGPHAVLPFLSQYGQSRDLLPAGGLGLWELSAELRVPLGENSTGVVFADASDVVQQISDYRVTHPHISPGLGFRYLTPVGLLRLDIGYRVPYLQRLGERYLEPEEGGPDPGEGDSFPFAANLAIGDAY